jgi:hypothetical protein
VFLIVLAFFARCSIFLYKLRAFAPFLSGCAILHNRGAFFRIKEWVESCAGGKSGGAEKEIRSAKRKKEPLCVGAPSPVPMVVEG